MDFEELLNKLGLDNDESKDKASILKKEYNARAKEMKQLNDSIVKLNEEAEASKAIADKFNIVVSSFGLDVNADDFDDNVEGAKERIIKEAGVGADSDEIKELKRNFAKATRENDRHLETIEELNKQLDSEKTQRINGVKRTAIQKAIIKNNIIDPEESIDLFFNRVSVDEDGVTVTMKTADGSDLPVADAIADWAKDHPLYVQKQVKGGLGSNGGGAGGANNNNEVSPFMQQMLKNKSDASVGVQGKSLGEMFG